MVGRVSQQCTLQRTPCWALIWKRPMPKLWSKEFSLNSSYQSLNILCILELAAPGSKLHLMPDVLSPQRAADMSPPVISSLQEELRPTDFLPVQSFLKTLPNGTISRDTANNLTQVLEHSPKHMLLLQNQFIHTDTIPTHAHMMQQFYDVHFLPPRVCSKVWKKCCLFLDWQR